MLLRATSSAKSPLLKASKACRDRQRRFCHKHDFALSQELVVRKHTTKKMSSLYFIPTYKIMKKFLALTVLVAAASVAAVAPAMADTKGGSFNVNTRVERNCTNPSAANIGLPNYDGTAAVTGSTTVKYKCTNGTDATLTLKSKSTTTLGSGNLKDGNGNSIPYTFDNSTTNATGDGVTSTGTVLGTKTTITVPAGVNPPAGSFSDDIDALVTY